MKKPTLCKTPQKCEDCKAYVTRDNSRWTESGWDEDVWDECAFHHYKKGIKWQEEIYNIRLEKWGNNE